MWTRTGVAICLLMMMTGVAEAHTQPQLDTWTEWWITEYVAAGPYVSPTLLAEGRDMRDRHPWYFSPIYLPPVASTRRAPLHEVEDWRVLLTQYFPVTEVERALCIISFESTGDPNAQNLVSGASGLFQHLPKYWDERSTAAGWSGASIWDPTANVAVAAWLWSRDGWRHWSPWLRGECK